MIIHVKAVGTLKALGEGSRIEALEVSEGISVAGVVEQLKIQDWEIGFFQINGQRATKESILQENDQLVVIAPLVGG